MLTATATRTLLDDLAVGATLVHRDLEPPAGSSIAIFGCGPIGLGSVLAAADRGCAPIFVVDSNTDRLLRACELGATHVIDPRSDDPVEAIRSVRRHGVRYAITSDGERMPDGCLATFGRHAAQTPGLP